MKNLNWRQTIQFLWYGFWYAGVLSLVEVLRTYWPVALILSLVFLAGMTTGLIVIR
jgi:hypothetical protein